MQETRYETETGVRPMMPNRAFSNLEKYTSKIQQKYCDCKTEKRPLRLNPFPPNAAFMQLFALNCNNYPVES